MAVLVSLVLLLLLPTHTSGARNPAVTQATIYQTICVHGYSKSIRPPSSYTTALKVKQLRAWHYRDQNPYDFEEDHFIPLSLGGAPRDPRNLWPEPWPQAHATDEVEFHLYLDVCDGRASLAQGQRAMIAWKKSHG